MALKFNLCLMALALSSAAASSLAPRDRAQALLVQMTLEEKITMLHGVGTGVYTGATAPIPRLGIPALALNDGRQGFRPQSGSATQTAFPCQLAVVSSFRTDLMHDFGFAMGQEFYGKGANVILAPMLIQARVPLDGRIFESTGEDPHLAYNVGYHIVAGMQQQPGVMSNADDFVLNNQETDRQSVSAVCDMRTLHETYYRGYKGAIDAGVSSVMCSYNRINGTYACENNVTLGDLKNPAGLNFSGAVLSDWGGTHSTVAAALAGLDQEMPSSTYFNASLYQAVQGGLVPESVIDDKVLRVLTPMFSQGLFDFPPSGGNQDTNVTSDAHNSLARYLAASGTVLLSNQNNVLPITPTVTTIVVVGDDADLDPRCCGTGSGALYPPYLITPLQGVTARAGPKVNVTYFPTPGVAANVTQWYSAERGDHYLDFECNECSDLYVSLRNEGYAYPTNNCASVGCIELQLWYNADTSSNLVTTAAVPPPSSGYSYVRPVGYILPMNYNDTAATAVLELWSGHDTPTGQPINSHLDYFTLATDASRAEAQAANYTKVASLGYVFLSAGTSPDFSNIIAAAAAADIAIVCVSAPSGEGTDRTDLNLDNDDEAIVAALVAAQPKTVVVLHNPGAVVMPWAPQAGAILSAWFPGQEMGNALADVLFGDVNPSGRLPVTFPMTNDDTPVGTPAQFPGVNGTEYYTEGLNFGYRWWDATNTQPRFPFGHGLSYTSFTYSNLAIDTQSQAPNVIVSATITNSGQVKGTEIAQLYLAFPASAGEPPRLLRGFTALLDLEPGQQDTAVFTMTPTDMSTWDVDAYAWSLAHGIFTASVGASSRDLRLNGTFNM